MVRWGSVSVLITGFYDLINLGKWCNSYKMEHFNEELIINAFSITHGNFELCRRGFNKQKYPKIWPWDPF
jgi:hypothetical protein